MKKGFTLVELLVVVVVLVTLMAIVFRLSNIGGDLAARNTTIQRMQRLENCLSGYFAAYGSYPPVALHAERDPYRSLNQYGRQDANGGTGALSAGSAIAACRAQPLASRFPFSRGMKDYVVNVARVMYNRTQSSDPYWKKRGYADYQQKFANGFCIIENKNSVEGWGDYSSWMDVQIFEFGLMSYLLPRYKTMLKGFDATQDDGSGKLSYQDLMDCDQWGSNNQLSSNPNTGKPFGSWEKQLMDDRLADRIPSQAVCARWMPNLKGIVACSSTNATCELYGVDVKDPSCPTSISADNLNIELFEGNGGVPYVLDSMTVYDGWGNEFFYYSPPPYQSYRLWSSGPDGKTFPPWIPLDEIPSGKEEAISWMADDIMFLSN